MSELTAHNISANHAMDMEKLPENTVLISINNEYQPLWPLKLDRQDPNVLTVCFSDITSNMEVKGQLFKPLVDDDIVKILKFTNLHKDKNFLVHCAAGISRSSAICLYLNQMYGHTLRPDFWKVSHPNYYVIGCLMVNRLRHPEL
jgi:predicted protein tyrosine phosphatase